MSDKGKGALRLPKNVQWKVPLTISVEKLENQEREGGRIRRKIFRQKLD